MSKFLYVGFLLGFTLVSTMVLFLVLIVWFADVVLPIADIHGGEE